MAIRTKNQLPVTGTGPRAVVGPTTARTLDKSAQILHMLVDGRNGAEIGEALGCSRQHAWQLPELRDTLKRAHRVFPRMDGKWVKSDKTWTFPGGATLLMTYLVTLEDATR